MNTLKEIEKIIIKELNLICKGNKISFSSKTPMVGPLRAIKSIQLVELLLKMEDYVEKNSNQKLNWADNSAMSETRSVLKTVNSLAKHILELLSKK